MFVPLAVQGGFSLAFDLSFHGPSPDVLSCLWSFPLPHGQTSLLLSAQANSHFWPPAAEPE